MRLIDADALLKKLNDEFIPYRADVNECIINAPTIDAVEVVRCKDCFLEDCKAKEFYGENGFCSIGERREP